MTTYFRITAYHPAENVTAIIDSHDFFKKLWEFSAALVRCGFKIIEVGNGEKFLDGNIPKPEADTKRVRACMVGKPTYTEQESRKAVTVKSRYYIPEK